MKCCFKKHHPEAGRLNNRRAFTLTEIAIVLGVIGVMTSGIWIAYGQVQHNADANRAADEISYIVNKVHSLSYTNSNFALAGGTDNGCIINYTVCAPYVLTCRVQYPVPYGYTTCTTTNGCTDKGCSPAPNNCSPGFTQWSNGTSNLNAALIAAGVVPSEMVSGTPAAPVVKSPWAQPVTVTVTYNTNDCSKQTPAAIAAAQALLAGAGVSGRTVIPAAGGSASGWGNLVITYANTPQPLCVKLLMAHGTDFMNLGLQELVVGNRGFNGPANATFTLPAVTWWCSNALNNIQLTFLRTL